MNKCLIGVLLLLPMTFFAQTITVSDDIVLKNDVAYEIIGVMKERLLLFRDRVTTFEIQAFDQQMRQVWSKELDLEKRAPKVLGIVPGPEDFTVLYHHRLKNHLVLRAARYDPAANLRDTATLHDFGFLFTTPHFEVIKSEDKSKAIIYYVENQNTFHAVSFDVATMKVLWQKSFAPENMSYWEEFAQIFVDNEGTMRIVLEKNRLRLRKDDQHYQIFEMGAHLDQPRTYEISLQDKGTYDAFFSYDNLNKRIVAGGLYSEKNLDRAAGYFYLNFSPDAPDNYLLSLEPFDDEFVSTLVGKNIDNNRGLNEVSIQQTVLRRDGGILMIGERNRQLERRMGSTNRVFFDGGVRFIVDYYFDEIFAISIHPDGKTHWKTILHKKQYSQDDDGMYSSFFLFKTPSNLRFLFNDEIRYENTVSEYVLNGTGNFERKSLMSTANLDLRLRFRDALQVSVNQLIIPSERRNRLRLVKLQYQ
ncbi:MAG: hypothetical protein ACK4TA_16755 [Saprospiraceae bacterium]